MLRFFRGLFGLIFLRPHRILPDVICKLRSLYYTLKIDSGGGKITITDSLLPFHIRKDKNSHLCIRGELKISPHIGGNAPALLIMGENAKLEINGDFVIGHGVRFYLSPNAVLKIGGQEKESASGITSDTLIMVSKRIEIGKDFVCAWNIFITDSDWHRIAGQGDQADVFIGDHVWIANSNNILKGAQIGNNVIVASNSKILNKVFPDDVLVGGIPPKILKSNIQWSRDIL